MKLLIKYAWKIQALFVVLLVLSLTGCDSGGKSSTGIVIQGDGNVVCNEEIQAGEDVAGGTNTCGNPETTTNPVVSEATE